MRDGEKSVIIDHIKTCYKLLYKVYNTELENDTNVQEDGESFEVVQFKELFDKIEGDYFYLLNDEEVLSGTFEVNSIQGKKPDEEAINGENLLFRAISKCKNDLKFNKKNANEDTRITDAIDQQLTYCIGHMMNECPKLIIAEDKNGYSALYFAIVKEYKGMVREMIRHLKQEKIPEATGSVFGRSVMLAGFPLGVAALTLNTKLFKCLLKGFSGCLGETIHNRKGDTIVHCLIKYVHYHCEKIDKDKVKKMLDYILDESTWRKVRSENDSKSSTIDPKIIVKELVMKKNKEHLTPLQLAAKRHQIDIFEILIETKHYNVSSAHNGLSTGKEYDITELETVPTHAGEKESSSDEFFVTENHNSVLEFVGQQNMSTAMSFAQCKLVNKVIKEKWQMYRIIFFIWAGVHSIMMSLLTWSGIHRSRIMFDYVSSNSEYVRNDVRPVRDDGLSLGLTIVGFLYALLVVFILTWRYLVHWCCYKRFQARMKANFFTNMWRIISELPYTNKIFEILFLLFGLLLILDLPLSIEVHDYDNLCLVFALILGWYSVTFFLQVFERFCIFTVLIQRVITDMINFAVVMAFLLLGFTVAMSMVMQGANDVDDFSGFDKSLVKMFTVMLGIGEMNDLFKARYSAAAVIVFVLFVLLTTVLLLNALIALMSNSCTELINTKYGVKKSNELHATLQRLSVILFLESLLPLFVTTKLQIGYTKDKYPCRRFIGFTVEIHDDDIGDDINENSHVNILKSILSSKHFLKRRKTKKVKTQPLNEFSEKNTTMTTLQLPWTPSESIQRLST